MKICRNILLITALAFVAVGCTGQKTPKYIFLMIGDGMGASQVAAAESYMSFKEGKLGGEQLLFTQFPVYGMCTTHSANCGITCSAASGTAISTGHKTNNNRLGSDPEGKPLRSMSYELHDRGYRVAIMSTVPINHATPSAFYASVADRDDCYEIITQLPGTGFEFFAGSGIIDNHGKKGNLPPADSILKANGYDVCYGLGELNASPDKEGVVLLQPSQRTNVLNYDVKYTDEDDTPAQVMATALDRLGDDKPFFIMYEGREIDWHGHGNNTMGVIQGILRFEEAIRVAYEFYLKHPKETLIVVTADHETGGIALGASKGYTLPWDKIENEVISDTWDTLHNRALSEEANIGWTSSSHTGGPVPVYAIGKNAERFTGRMDNTEFYSKICFE